MTTHTMKSLEINSSAHSLRLNRGIAFGLIIIIALLAFELFNYGTTDYALNDLLGDISFLGLRWATILAIAFCCIDFAGIARLFTPDCNTRSTNETWYLFGAWILAATMNALLTWWGVSHVILNHQTMDNIMIERQTLIRSAPIFVAILVWLSRVLIIVTLSIAGDKLFVISNEDSIIARQMSIPKIAQLSRPIITNIANNVVSSRCSYSPRSASDITRRQPNKTQLEAFSEPEYAQPELIYHPVSMRNNRQNLR